MPRPSDCQPAGRRGRLIDNHSVSAIYGGDCSSAEFLCIIFLRSPCYCWLLRAGAMAIFYRCTGPWHCLTHAYGQFKSIAWESPPLLLKPRHFICYLYTGIWMLTAFNYARVALCSYTHPRAYTLLFFLRNRYPFGLLRRLTIYWDKPGLPA